MRIHNKPVKSTNIDNPERCPRISLTSSNKENARPTVNLRVSEHAKIGFPIRLAEIHTPQLTQCSSVRILFPDLNQWKCNSQLSHPKTKTHGPSDQHYVMYVIRCM